MTTCLKHHQTHRTRQLRGHSRGLGGIRNVFIWNMTPGYSRPHWVRHKVVGISCFCYLLPSACYLILASNLMDAIQSALAALVAFGFAAVSITAYFSEFVHIPVLSNDQKSDWLVNPSKYPPSAWGLRDRKLSCFVTSVAFVESLTRVGVALTVVSTATSLLFIFFSRSSRSSDTWVIRHSLWHLVSSIIPSILSFI
jgi:hypothetical protein